MTKYVQKTRFDASVANNPGFGAIPQTWKVYTHNFHFKKNSTSG